MVNTRKLTIVPPSIEGVLKLDALALSRNTDLSNYLDGIADRMKQGRTATLDQVLARFDVPAKRPRAQKRT